MGTDMGSVITRGLTHWLLLLNNRADINIEKLTSTAKFL